MTNAVKIADKFAKVNDSFTVYRYDNGYGIEISGRVHQEGDWTNTKLVCTSIDELFVLIKEALTIQLD